MILEIATIDIKRGTNSEFEKNLALAQNVLRQADGYIEHEFQRCVERENRYVLLIKWTILEAHTIGFRGSDLFQQWRGFIGPFFENPPQVEHFTVSDIGFETLEAIPVPGTPNPKSPHPPRLFEDYKSTLLRAPAQPLLPIKLALRDFQKPVYGDFRFGEFDADLTKNARKNGEPIGERIVVHGKVTNEFGQAIPGALVEIWQANAAGRYIHKVDQHEAPLDPNFLGAGRCLTDAEGNYKFYTIKPGAYPWGNHPNAWRPNHIHFSLFGRNLGSRLVTQMYFPGDPLFEFDPIFKSVPAPARELLVSKFDLSLTEPNFALAYRFNIVLRDSYFEKK